MKKKNLKLLRFNKKSISNFYNVYGRGTEQTLSIFECPQGVYSIPEPGNPICPTTIDDCTQGVYTIPEPGNPICPAL